MESAMTRSLICLAVLSAVLAPSSTRGVWARGQASATSQAGPSDEQIKATLVARLLPGPDTGIVAGIVGPTGRRIIVAGKAGPAGARSLDARTVFEIGSATKVFTAALLMDMVIRGEVHLDEPIAKYLPASVRVPSRGGRQITLVDLATHTSGLPRLPSNLNPKDLSNPYADYTVDRLYDFLSGYQLTRDIGQQYEYSNLGMGLLGHLLALREGTSYEALLRARVLEPLQMRETAIVLSPELRSRLAVGHDAAGTPVANWDLPTLAGAGALRSTLDDMLRFLQANLDAGGPLGPVLAQTHAARHSLGTPDGSIGLGWHVRRTSDGEIVWHNGGTGGYHSFIGFDPKAGTGVVLLHNSAASVDDIGFHLLDPRLPLAAPPAPRKPRTEVKLDAGVLEKYVGEYRLTPAFSIVVTREAEQLFIQATGQSKLPIFAESETGFFLKAVDAQVSFSRDSAGRVTGLVLHQNGRDVPGEKVR
jgi:D-alanyl-D-alanine-carboxypeptidase/D-alanyl-D-alanine-endopeptidase